MTTTRALILVGLLILAWLLSATRRRVVARSPRSAAAGAAFAKAWRTAMYSRCFDAPRYAGPPTPHEVKVACRLVGAYGTRAAYRLLEWCMEDRWYWAEADTLEHFEQKFAELDALRLRVPADSKVVEL